MIKPVRLVAYTSFIAITACAAQPSAPYAQAARAPQCFHASEVLGYTSAPDGWVQLQTAQGPFQVRLDPSCPDFSWMMQVGVRPMDSSWLCEGQPQEIITAYQSPFNRCRITAIEGLASSTLPA